MIHFMETKWPLTSGLAERFGLVAGDAGRTFRVVFKSGPEGEAAVFRRGGVWTVALAWNGAIRALDTQAGDAIWPAVVALAEGIAKDAPVGSAL